MPTADYLKEKILDHTLGYATFNRPTSIYLALFTDNLASAEVNGGSYSRKLVTFDKSNNYSSSNYNSITFTNMPGVTILSWALMTSFTGGNMLYYFTTNIVVASGNTLGVLPGNLEIGY